MTTEKRELLVSLNCLPGCLSRLLIIVLFALLVSCAKEEPAVSFDVETADGRFFSSEHTDKIVYLDFWATWCGPCRESFPWMNEMREKYQSKGLQIIAVSIDADTRLARQFVEEMGASFEIGYDPEGKVADLFEVNVMPTSAILGTGGKIVEIHKGFNEDKKTEYEKAIVAALKTLP